MQFSIKIGDKELEFNSQLEGLAIGNKEYLARNDGLLIYEQVKGLKADKVRLQMSTNTSTLIPALHILSISYNPYFDEREIIESQNNITFYWNRSKLAAYYNRFSTDQLDFSERELLVRKAVNFLTKNVDKLPLEDELLNKISEPIKLLGFYRGFPIFDGMTGFAKLQSRLGIHIEPESIMISSPLDKYQSDVYELADQITDLTKVIHTKKKNRVSFPKDRAILNLLGVK